YVGRVAVAGPVVHLVPLSSRRKQRERSVGPCLSRLGRCLLNRETPPAVLRHRRSQPGACFCPPAAVRHFRHFLFVWFVSFVVLFPPFPPFSFSPCPKPSPSPSV